MSSLAKITIPVLTHWLAKPAEIGERHMKRVILAILLLCGLESFFCGASEEGVDCGDDKLCQNCLSDPRPPWCYSDRVVAESNSEMCLKIKSYWKNATSVADYCLYQIAKKEKDCSLCARIESPDISRICQQDCH